VSDLIVMALDPEKAPVDVAWGNSADLVLQDLPNVAFSGDRYHRPAWQSKDAQGHLDFTPYTGRVMFIDPSGRGKDETAYAVVYILHGRLFLMAWGGFRDGYSPETLEALALIGYQHKVTLIQTEPNFGDGMFNQLFAPVVTRVCTEQETRRLGTPTHASISIEDSERSQAQKEKRIIDTLEPVLNGHRLVVNQSVIEDDFRSTQGMPLEEASKYQGFYQLTRITREKGALVRDDRVDALAGAVGYWVEQMARDMKTAAADHRQRALDQELQKFMEHSSGRHGLRHQNAVGVRRLG
jgi:hypothetical protein